MTRVAIDDPVTVVFQSMTLCLTVEKVDRESFYCNANDGLPDIGGLPLTHKDEGVFWVRGWYTPDAEEVKAARVAQGLGEHVQSNRPSYRELERAKEAAERARQQAVRELREAREKQHEVEQRRNVSWTEVRPNTNESYSDAAARRKWGRSW